MTKSRRQEKNVIRARGAAHARKARHLLEPARQRHPEGAREPAHRCGDRPVREQAGMSHPQ